MRIHHIITEATADERFIQRLAVGIDQFAKQYAQSHSLPKYLEPGTVADVTGITSTNPTEQYLLNIGVVFTAFPKDFAHALGAYRPADGEYSADVGFDVRYLANTAELAKRKAFQRLISSPGRDLVSTATHELRHALDDYLSAGRYDQSNRSYNAQPHEINARFSEVLQSLGQKIQAGAVNRNNFLTVLKSELAQFNIEPTPRLIKRAYDYFAN